MCAKYLLHDKVLCKHNFLGNSYFKDNFIYSYCVGSSRAAWAFSRGAAREGCSGCGAQVHHCGGCPFAEPRPRV